jgi:hypothetical protein
VIVSAKSITGRILYPAADAFKRYAGRSPSPGRAARARVDEFLSNREGPIVTAMVGVKKRRGRPKGSGGPPEGVRRNRVTATFTDAEFAQLERLAASKNIRLGTMLTKISLGRRR